MQRHIDSLMQPLETAEEYSFGANLINTPGSRYALDGRMIDLQARVGLLNRSEHYDDKAAVARIYNDFNAKDFQVAASTLSESLDTPLKFDIFNWAETTSPRDLEQFCRWSLQRTLELQSSLYRDSDELIGDTIHRARKLSQMGLFPNHAVAIIGSSIQHTQLRGMDTIYSSGRQYAGVSRPNKIILSNQYDDPVHMIYPSLQMKKTLFHENLHNVRPQYGFNMGITQHSHDTIYLEEAFVEHANVVAFNDSEGRQKHQIVNPNKRPDRVAENGSYPAERTFLAFLLDQTNLTIEQVADTFFSRYDDKIGQQLRSELDRKIGKFFGSSERFAAFSNEYQQLYLFDREDLLKRQIRTLKGSWFKNPLRGSRQPITAI